MGHRRTHSRSFLPTYDSRSRSTLSFVPAMSSALLTIGYPRKRRRMTSLALFALITLSMYIFFVVRPSLAHAPIELRADSRDGRGGLGRRIYATNNLLHSRLFQNSPSYRRNLPPSAISAKPQVHLDHLQELAAVTSFLASLPQNIIPSSVNPSQPIDPQLVLDFDTRSPRAADEVGRVVEDVWARNPVILFSQSWSSRSRQVKAMISELNLSPPPTVFDVDEREDASVLIPLLYRITSSTELPILLVGGKPIGTLSQISSSFESGDLHEMVSAAGAVVGGDLQNGKGRR